MSLAPLICSAECRARGRAVNRKGPMRHNLSNVLGIVVLLNLLSACESFGEGAKGLSRPSYSEAKTAREDAKKSSPIELDRLFAECPKPNGVFQNDAMERGGVRLEQYFLVPGFEIPATSYPGGKFGDPALAASASPIEILGGKIDGVWLGYNKRTPQERFTLELRPLEKGRFRIGVKSSLGPSGEADGYFNLSGERKRCENGVLKAFWRNYDKIVPGWELYVEPATGDIVMVYNTAKERGEISYRFKRIGN